MDRQQRVLQKTTLYKVWGFRLDVRERDEDPFVWRLKGRRCCIEIIWNLKSQSGAYTFDGDLCFINSWNMLVDLMDQLEDVL